MELAKDTNYLVGSLILALKEILAPKEFLVWCCDVLFILALFGYWLKSAADPGLG
jgi:hypothetical protein